MPRKESEKQKRGQNTDKSPSEFFPPKISIIIMKKERKEGKKDVNLKHFQCGLAHRMHTHTHTHYIYIFFIERSVPARERESAVYIRFTFFFFRLMIQPIPLALCRVWNAIMLLKVSNLLFHPYRLGSFIAFASGSSLCKITGEPGIAISRHSERLDGMPKTRNRPLV